jgi:AcrR family transcriptional regulator
LDYFRYNTDVPDDDRSDMSAPLEWRHALRSHESLTPELHEGLRERKKRLMRQLISDTATLLFLERGFDEVKITEIADACGVSEKTIYNYFPTKESLVFDQEESMTLEIERELGPQAGHRSPVDAVVAIIEGRLRQLVSYAEQSGQYDMAMIQSFAEMIAATPSLANAQMEMTERIVQVAAEAMAQHAGIDPDDPEPQIAANSLLGLWRVYFRATYKYAQKGISLHEYHSAVLEDVRRAARLVESGLWSFSMAVQGTNSRDQLKSAADASNEARKQVMSAIKQAKTAWRQLETDLKSQRENHEKLHQMGEAHQQNARRVGQQLRRDAQNFREEAQRAKLEARAARQSLRNEIRQQMKDAKPRKKA